MSHSGAGGATTTPSHDNMTHTSLTGPAAIAQTASEEPAILALPPELQKTIVAYLTSYTDMKSACLVCKQLNDIATPYLYRKMEITGQFLRSDGFKAAITTRNPGLASVKTVRIVCPYSTSAEIGLEACLLLSTIPRNSLTRLELPRLMSPPVARDIFNCVRRKQRNVDNYQYDSVHLNGSSEAFVADVEYRARLKHFKLCLWDSQDNEQASTVLDSMHELTSLDVHLREVCYTVNPAPLNLVFHPFSIDHQRPWIKSLRLDCIDFSHLSGAFPRLPGVRNLKHLQLVYCGDYGYFLKMLTELSIDLVTFTIDDLDTDSGSFGYDSSELVRSLNSLERVSLTLDATFKPPRGVLDWSTLHKCASVLKSLKVQYHSLLPPYPSDKSLSDFRRLCRNASSLEQLSMSGIEVHMNKVSEDKDTHGSLEQFMASLHLNSPLERVIADMRIQDCVKTASALVVLKLTMWVSHNTVPLSNDASIEAHVREAQNLAQRREHLVKVTADRILSTLASSCPKLKVVVIETMWEYSRDDSAVRAFLRSKQTDLYGRTTVVGMPVELCMVKHYEPCSGILDFEPDRFVFA